MRAEIRRTIGEYPPDTSYRVAGQYQQAPAPLGGGLVKPAWFKRYLPAELPAAFDRLVQSWDTPPRPASLPISASAPAGASTASRRSLSPRRRGRMFRPSDTIWEQVSAFERWPNVSEISKRPTSPRSRRMPGNCKSRSPSSRGPADIESTFWKSKPLEQLAADQGVLPIIDIMELDAIWSEGDAFHGALSEVLQERAQRRRDARSR